MRRGESARNTLPVSGDGKWALPVTRRTEHGAENAEGIDLIAKNVQRAEVVQILSPRFWPHDGGSLAGDVS